MRGDMWRLYRHFLIGGVIIALLCYGVIEWLQVLHKQRIQQRILYADAELSVELYRSNVFPLEFIDNHSLFSWSQVGVLPLTDAYELSLELPDSKEFASVTVSSGKEVYFTGKSQTTYPMVMFSLLKAYLNSNVSLERKRALLQSLSWMQLREQNLSGWENLKAVNMLTAQGERSRDISLFWYPGHGEKVWEIQMKEVETLSISVVIMLLIVGSMAALMVLVWFEFLNLDRRRAHFETITRQIARGRGVLPQGVVDSSGTLKELAYSFDSMSTHIQRLLKVQREMINAISHELRTPIARLRFGLEALKDDVDERTEKSVTALEYDVEELNTLVDEVLTYGKLEEGSLALNFEMTSIAQIINSIVEHNHSLLQKFEVSVTISDEDTVNADSHHLHRALQNLILNASKYANSKIAITFSCDQERWQVDIEDDGPGIPIEDRDKVFIPFQRLDNSRTRASGGYGLGLAIVQRIAFWHGGAVLIESSELGGAKFSFIWSRRQHQNSLS